jgi:hypothetical protein
LSNSKEPSVKWHFGVTALHVQPWTAIMYLYELRNSNDIA